MKELEMCSICLDTLRRDRMATNCYHRYHYDCLREYCDYRLHENVPIFCPLCGNLITYFYGLNDIEEDWTEIKCSRDFLFICPTREEIMVTNENNNDDDEEVENLDLEDIRAPDYFLMKFFLMISVFVIIGFVGFELFKQNI